MGPNSRNVQSSRKFGSEKIIYFKDDSIIIIVFFGVILVIVRMSTGSDFDKMFEVPEII